MRLRLLDALGVRARAGLDDMPSLGLADADSLAGKTLAVAIAALPVRRKPDVVVVVAGDEDVGDGEDEEDGELHCEDLVDVGVGVIVVGGLWLLLFVVVALM